MYSEKLQCEWRNSMEKSWQVKSKNKSAAVETKGWCVGGTMLEYSTGASIVGNFIIAWLTDEIEIPLKTVTVRILACTYKVS